MADGIRGLLPLRLGGEGWGEVGMAVTIVRRRTALARKLRREGTDAERLLWRALLAARAR